MNDKAFNITKVVVPALVIAALLVEVALFIYASFFASETSKALSQLTPVIFALGSSAAVIGIVFAAWVSRDVEKCPRAASRFAR